MMSFDWIRKTKMEQPESYMTYEIKHVHRLSAPSWFIISLVIVLASYWNGYAGDHLHDKRMGLFTVCEDGEGEEVEEGEVYDEH